MLYTLVRLDWHSIVLLYKRKFYFFVNCMNFKKTFWNFSIIAQALSFPLIAVAQQSAEAPLPPELQPPTFASSFAEMAPMFGIVFFIFYFMVIKPQQTKQMQQEKLIKNLAKGATVITSSGIIGRVAGIEKDYILLELAMNVKVKFQPAHIVKAYEPTAEKSAAEA